MSKDIQGMGLGLASRFAGSQWAQKSGLAKKAERIVYLSTREGFKLAGKLSQKRQQKKAPVKLLSDGRRHHLFDLTLSDEQEMIRDSVQAYATEVLREQAAAANEATQLGDDFFTDLSALGLGLFAVPEALGGASQGYSPTTSAIIAEELAYGDFSLAAAALAPVAVANALTRWGSLAQQKKYLPLWTAEHPMRAAIAVQEAHPLFDPYQLTTQAKAARGGYELNGCKVLVPLNGQADLYLVAALYKGKPQIFIVPGKASGLSFCKAPAMGLRAAATGTLTLNKVQLGKEALLGSPDKTLNYQEFIDLGQLHWCALALGTCKAALHYTINYANERLAFGEPISHRQSVAFMIADMGTEIEAMRLMLWRAAALAEAGKAFHREAYLAHLFCQQKALQIGTDAVQILGGHGFTKEHPAERWYRDLTVLGAITSGLHL